MTRRSLALEKLDEFHRRYEEDPWCLHWRGVEQVRHAHVLSVLGTLDLSGSTNTISTLDVGCSRGDFSGKLHNLTGEVTAVDVSQTAVDIATSRYNLDGLVFISQTIPGSSLARGVYDLATCLEVIYYLQEKDRNKFIFEISELLRPGGTILITSLVGGAPYFQPQELQTLVERSFEEPFMICYGWSMFQRFEQNLFRLYWRLNLAHHYTSGDNGDRDEVTPNSSTRESLAKHLLVNLGEMPVFGWLLRASLVTFSSTVKVLLIWQGPGRLAHRFARLLRLTPSHTIIVARKSPDPADK